jgi:hypothetical protein
LFSLPFETDGIIKFPPETNVKTKAGKREGRTREEGGKREWEKPIQELFPTLTSLCLSLRLPSLSPFIAA